MNLRSFPSADLALQTIANPGTMIHFSQFGEDAIVESMMGAFKLQGRPGFYVDVGAHHPVDMSNTRLLHLKGWRGVNIDANPAAVALFDQHRPKDRNVHAAVSDEETVVEFDIYELNALSTADPKTKAENLRSGRSRVVKQIHLRTRTLASILNETVPEGQRIDLMSVDAEGFDLRVLRSNDWSRFAPHMLLVEDPAMSLIEKPDSAIFRFLKPLGYRLASLAYITSIYLRDQPVRV